MSAAWPILGALGPWTQFLVSPQVGNLKMILQSLVEYSQGVSNCKGV